jgi:TRAP-type C4-dicarboxylate transport system permease small subunit
MLHVLEKWLRRISRAMAWCSGGIVLVSAVLVGLDVATRALFQRVVFESFEFSSYGFAVVIGLGLAHTAIERSNVRVDVINAHLPRGAARALDLLAIAALAGFAVVLAWQTTSVALASMQMGARSNSSLAVPLVYPQGLWAMGVAWFALVSIFLALRALGAAARRDWTKVDRIAGLRLTHAADRYRESV